MLILGYCAGLLWASSRVWCWPISGLNGLAGHTCVAAAHLAESGRFSEAELKHDTPELLEELVHAHRPASLLFESRSVQNVCGGCCFSAMPKPETATPYSTSSH